MSVSAYPLAWPDGWPRMAPGKREDSRHRFKTGGRSAGPTGVWEHARPVTFDAARSKLQAELGRLGATSVVISSNLPLRQDGQARADAARARIDDPGVAVYFVLRKKPMVMASDRYDAPSANLRSIGLAIEAMRQLDRHGGGAMMERAFAGFAALPPPGKKPWRSVLGDVPPTRESISAAYRAAAARRHPDAGGSTELMAELNEAREDALREAAA